jgi:TonB family protein
MFDKLIVSDEQGAEFKGRSRYFMVSTLVVGVLFVTAVVFSLYAADIGLGNAQFEVSMMVAPVTPEAPEPPKPVQAQNQAQSNRSELPVRTANILRIEENPITPPDVSVTRNTSLSRPPSDFNLGNVDKVGTGPANSVGPGTSEGGTSSAVSSEPASDIVKLPDPPPPITAKPAKPAKTMVSEGVINGKATYLPVPAYPQPAKMVNAYGAVNVQVVIDESGTVISSRAVSGHPLLKQAAERAAFRAKFSTTYLSKVPVKVTGVIVYNFKKS